MDEESAPTQWLARGKQATVGASAGRREVAFDGLICEEDPHLLKLLVRVFGKDYRVKGCTELREALSEIDRAKFIVGDIKALGEGGLEALEAMANSGLTSPSMVVSGTAVAQALVSRLNGEGIVVVEKPYAPAGMLALVHELLDG